MNKQSFILNGKLQQNSSLQLSCFDLGLAQGLGCFETLWAAPQSLPFAASAHYARLQASCKRFSLCPPSLETLLEQSQQLRQVLELNEFAVRLRWTFWQQSWHQSHCLITLQAAQAPSHPAKVQLSTYQFHSKSPLAGHKSTSYAPFALLLKGAQEAGFDEVIYCNETGHLVEGATSNLFFLQQEQSSEQIKIYTPPLSSGCLPGVTRAELIKLLQSKEFAQNTQLLEKPISAQELSNFHAAFLTNSQVGIRFIAQIEDQVYDSTHPSFIALKKSFDQLRNTKKHPFT